MKPMTVAFASDEARLDLVYGQGRRDAIAERASIYPHRLTTENLADHLPELQDVEAIFGGWGMPVLQAEHLDRLPRLRAVFYAAGSVQRIARPLLERGITLVSAWAANGVPVAEFTVAQIVLANKGYFQCIRRYAVSSEDPRTTPYGNFDQTVALLGAGMIGRKVIELLKAYRLHVIVYDPYLLDSDAVLLGVEKATLEEAFARAIVVSNHLPQLPATIGMLTGAHFASMRPNAVFINTGRGGTVREDEMTSVLAVRPDLVALLDVTDPEPPLFDSPLRTQPNVFLSPHLAGSHGDEILRMADYAIEEFDRWRRGEPLRYAVTAEMLETMA
ncbi:MAG: hydroxyacid dehydrogenase [Capsulimonas sp.]|uniref:hydroxyacid dehydrogenase n=1 Tax=Capsulimonas sp. TaxID=2494211 RepID=UPI003265E965